MLEGKEWRQWNSGAVEGVPCKAGKKCILGRKTKWAKQDKKEQFKIFEAGEKLSELEEVKLVWSSQGDWGPGRPVWTLQADTRNFFVVQQ